MRTAADEFETLVEATLHINSSQNLETMCANILEAACRVLDTEAASLLLVDAPTGHLKWLAALGPAGPALLSQDLRPGEGIAGWVASSAETVVCNEASTDDRFCHRIDAYSGFTTRAILCAPMVARGRVLGVLELINPRSGADARRSGFEPHDVRKAQAFASLSAIALDSADLIRLAEQVGNAREISRFKTDMVSVMAEELRTPLTTIRGFSELLGDESLQLDAARRFGTLIHEEARRLERMIEDLLGLTRLETGQVPMHEAVVALGPVLERCVTRRAAEGSGHVLRVDWSEGDAEPRVAGDPERVAEIVDRLLDNAVRFAPDGGDVVVTCERAGGTWRVSIKDRGLGIPESALPRLFHPFFRVSDPRSSKQRGTGLGLTAVKTLVERMGGTVGAMSQLGVGSTFWFTLPAA